jgi:hypothetical protein
LLVRLGGFPLALTEVFLGALLMLGGFFEGLLAGLLAAGS